MKHFYNIWQEASPQFVLEQIKDKKYYEKYLSKGKTITLVGVAFDTKIRNIAHWLSAST